MKNDIKNVLYKKIINAINPIDVTIELIRSCNLKCDFCYLGEKRNYELEYEKVMKTLREIRKMGGMNILFTGGEPLLYSRLNELLIETKEMGFICSLNTNGTLINEKNAQLLADLLTTINISIHSFNAEEHDELVGKKGAYEEAINGIKLLQKYNGKIVINTVVTNKIEDKILKMKQFVENELKCEWHPDSRIVPTYSGNTFAMEKRIISEEKLEEVLKTVNAYKFKDENTFSTGICSAARKTCFIDAEGYIYPCLQFKNYEKNYREDIFLESIYNKSFEEIWNTNAFFKEIRNISQNDFSKCMKCKNYKKCYKCIAENYAATKQFGIPSKEICRRERLYAFVN